MRLAFTPLTLEEWERCPPMPEVPANDTRPVQVWLWLFQVSEAKRSVKLKPFVPRKTRTDAKPMSVRRPLTGEEREQLATIERSLAIDGIETYGIRADGRVRYTPPDTSLCPPADQPCGFVACRHHNYLEVNPENGAIKINFPGKEVWEIPSRQTCSLREADRDENGGEHSLEEVGQILNVTFQQAWTIESSAFRKMAVVDPELVQIMKRRDRHTGQRQTGI